MIFREARLEDASAIARVHVDSWRTTYADILPADYLASLAYQKRESNWEKMLANAQEKNHSIFVAQEHPKEIVAFADGGKERTGNSLYQGELYAIYILHDYQQQGIGRNLVRLVAKKLAQLGFNSMLVWVLEENPACRFYETIGGEQIAQKQITIAGVELNEIAYGWIDTGVLIAT